MYQIDKDIPIPVEEKPVSPYPFASMEIGDSFLVPCKKKQRLSVDVRLVGEEIKFRKRTDSSYHFRSHYVDGGVRVWRVI